MLFVLFGLFLLLLQIPLIRAANPATLRHLQLFFRHGQRAPTSFLTFPSELNAAQIEEHFPYALGEMTFDGIWQEYLLGQSIRQLYGRHLGEDGIYRSNEIGIYSGRDNRTVCSAQLVLAGLFPPQDRQLWNPALRWQPIPVETQPILDHVSFGLFDHCPRESGLLVHSKGFAQLRERNAGQMAELAAKTGVNITNLEIYQKVLDAIVSRANLNPKLLPLPSWASAPEYLAHIQRAKVELHEGFTDLFLAKMGGWHLDQLLGRMDDAVNGRSAQKTMLYSAHDTNFLAIGRFLGIELIDDIMPDYASLLAIELHKPENEKEEEGSNEHFIQMRFRSGLNGTFSPPLHIAKCPSLCRLSKFRALGPRVTSMEWWRDCGMEGNGAAPNSTAFGDPPAAPMDCTAFETIAASLLVLVVLLLGALLSLLISCRSYKRRYLTLLEADEYSPLLRKRQLD